MDKNCILQVEDEESDIVLLQHAMKSVGISYPLQVVTDGQEAVDYLSGSGRFTDRKTYPPPCLVLLDLKLPDRTGFDVLEWMRGQADLKTTAVIALTSSSHEDDIHRAYELGANSYVVKPMDNQERVEMVRRLKEWWLECNLFVGDERSPEKKAR